MKRQLLRLISGMLVTMLLGIGLTFVIAHSSAYAQSAGQRGRIALRVAEFSNGHGTNGYLNGVTVKLTDTSGNTQVSQAESKCPPEIQMAYYANCIGGANDGWVYFDSVPVGSYGIMAYKPDYTGSWKMVNCSTPGGSTQSATIQNANTEGNVAAWDNNVPVTANQTTVCHDLGIQRTDGTGWGNLRFRIREFDQNNHWTGRFLNDVPVSIIMSGGNKNGYTTAEVKSKAVDGQDGWVWLDNVQTTRGYQIGNSDAHYLIVWRQPDCNDPDGSTGYGYPTQQYFNLNPQGVTVCKDVGVRISN